MCLQVALRVLAWLLPVCGVGCLLSVSQCQQPLGVTVFQMRHALCRSGEGGPWAGRGSLGYVGALQAGGPLGSVLCRWILCHCSFCRNQPSLGQFHTKDTNTILMFQENGKGTHDFFCVLQCNVLPGESEWATQIQHSLKPGEQVETP